MHNCILTCCNEEAFVCCLCLILLYMVQFIIRPFQACNSSSACIYIFSFVTHTEHLFFCWARIQEVQYHLFSPAAYRWQSHSGSSESRSEPCGWEHYSPFAFALFWLSQRAERRSSNTPQNGSGIILLHLLLKWFISQMPPPQFQFHQCPAIAPEIGAWYPWTYLCAASRSVSSQRECQVFLLVYRRHSTVWKDNFYWSFVCWSCL